MKKKITMQDIAKMANVSRMTVSRYFSGGYVSQENKEKIKTIIEEHEYIPNVYAQSLKKKLDVIGVILPTIVSRTSTKLLKGIIDELERRNFDYLITTAENSEEKELKALQNFQNLNVKGVISLTINPLMYANRKKNLNNMEVVLITQVPVDMPAIIYPDMQAAREIVAHLIKPHQNKIKRICLLSDGMVFSTRESFIKQEVEEIVPQIPFYEILAPHNADGPLNLIPDKGTFYICVTDQIAYNLYETVHQSDWKIGKDLFIIGFGDYTTSKSQVPPLTSVSLPYYEAGVAAASKLFDEENDSLNEYMSFSIEERESTL